MLIKRTERQARRSTLAAALATQSAGSLDRRTFLRRSGLTPDDVKRMAQPVLSHRLILKPESRLRKRTSAAVVQLFAAEG